MADVYGTIGSEQVELNNAATEATLRLILEGIKGSSKGAAEAITKYAKQSGVDPAAVAAANEGLGQVGAKSVSLSSSLTSTTKAFGEVSTQVRSAFNDVTSFTEKLTSSGAQASDLFNGLSRLPFGLGLVATGFEKVAKFQENSLKSYQDLAASGANFNGSLVNMRMAALNSFMTMEQFTRVVKENSDVFSTMPGGVKAGLDQFVKIQSRLNQPGTETAATLANLGVSFEESGSLIGSYMRQQGSMNKQGLQNTEQVTQGVIQYTKELSALSSLTGESREALQKKLDEEALDAQFALFLSGLDQKTADKMRQSIASQMAAGGKGAVDSFKALAMNFPPLTDASQIMTSTMKSMTVAQREQLARARDSSISVEENAKLNAATTARQIKDQGKELKTLQPVLQASALAGDGFSKSFDQAAKMVAKTNGQTEEAIRDQLLSTDKLADAKDKEAVLARETAAAMLKLQQEIMNTLLPIFQRLQPEILKFFTYLNTYNPAMQKFGESLLSSVNWMLTHTETVKGLIAQFALASIALKAFQLVLAAKELQGKPGGMPSGGGMGMPGAPGSSPTNFIWVKIVPEGIVPTGTPAPDGTPGDGKDKNGKTGKDGIKSKIGRYGAAGAGIGGLVLGTAGDYMIDEGKTGAGGLMNVGADALTGAALGAMLGPIGAGIGAALGGSYGIYKNWDNMFGPSPTPKAAGGIVNPGSYLVGEKGPEVLNIGASGNIITNENMSTIIARSIERDNKITNALETLNNTMTDVKRHMAATSDNTSQTISVIRDLNHDRMPRP